jgi:hypothetical protein
MRIGVARKESIMSRYQVDEEYFDYPVEANSEELQERKAKRGRRVPYSAHQTGRSAAVEIVAWSMVGIVGFVLAVGSIIVAADGSDNAWVVAIPMIYMLAAMRFMRRS